MHEICFPRTAIVFENHGSRPTRTFINSIPFERFSRAGTKRTIVELRAFVTITRFVRSRIKPNGTKLTRSDVIPRVIITSGRRRARTYDVHNVLIENRSTPPHTRTRAHTLVFRNSSLSARQLFLRVSVCARAQTSAIAIVPEIYGDRLRAVTIHVP